MNDRAEPKAQLKHAQNATGHLHKRKIPILSICQYVTLEGTVSQRYFLL